MSSWEFCAALEGVAHSANGLVQFTVLFSIIDPFFLGSFLDVVELCLWILRKSAEIRALSLSLRPLKHAALSRDVCCTKQGSISQPDCTI